MIPVVDYASSWEILIDTPVPDPGTVATYTSLFRATSHIPEAMNLSYDRAEEGALLHVISAGCSYGAEVDTVLSLHANYGDGRAVQVTGLDRNPDVIKIADEGQYRTYTTYHERFIVDERSLLEKHGFKANRVADGDGAYVEIDARPVRAGNFVQFILHDLTMLLPVDVPADLVLANNVLYHLEEDERQQAAANLASVLSRSGVLSFGRYVGDYEKLHQMLIGDFDLEWVDFGKPIEEGPYMFSRR